MFETFKDKDIQLVIEFKSAKNTIVPIFKELVDQYEIYDQVTVIAYETTGQHDELMEHFSEMTAGLLYNSIAPNDSKIDGALKDPVSKVQLHNATLNPNYSGFSAPYVRAATYRGITVWPYTINTEAQVHNSILYGYTAITSDYSSFLGKLTKDLSVSFGDTVLPGSTVPVQAEVTSYKRETTDASDSAVLTIIEGEELIEKINGLELTLKQGAEGEICFLVSYEQKLSAGKSYTVYTQPLTVKVTSDAPAPSPSEEDGLSSEMPTPDTSVAPEDSEETAATSKDASTPEDMEQEEKKDTLPVALIVGIPVILLLVLGGVIVLIIVKKKK